MRYETIDISVEELEQLVEQAGLEPLPSEGQRKLKAALYTLRTVVELLADRDTTIGQLRALVQGAHKTEKTRKVLQDCQPDPGNDDSSEGQPDAGNDDSSEGQPDPDAADTSASNKKPGKRKGHGRNGAASYTGAQHVGVAHTSLKASHPAAPIDNNICERALKKAILHRKNSLFYQTINGSRVGDLFMSLIYTAELSGANPFDYLTQLHRHGSELARAPARWMPWNYTATLIDSDRAASTTSRGKSPRPTMQESRARPTAAPCGCVQYARLPKAH